MQPSPPAPITLPTPPALPDAEPGNAALTSALPMLAGMGSMVMMAGMSGVGQTRALVAGGFFLLSTALVIATQVLRQRRQHQRRVDEGRTSFLRALAVTRGELAAAAEQRRLELETEFPPLTSHAPRGAGTRVRLGVATLPPSRPVACHDPDDPDRADPFAVRAVAALLSCSTADEDLPLVLDLGEWDEVIVEGPSEAARDRMRSLVCHAALTGGPETWRMVLAASPDHLHHWEWLKWLPQLRSTSEHDVTAGRRHVLPDYDLPPATPGTSTLVVVDGGHVDPSLVAAPDTTVLRVHPAGATPDHRRAVLRRGDGEHDLLVTPTGSTPYRADTCSHDLAASVARTVQRAWCEQEESAGSRLDDLPTMLGIDDVESWQPQPGWERRAPAHDLRVPIGLDADGQVLHLDLKESALGGDGPHGLVVGATGSGKSELLRTLVLALSLQHSPEDLGMVLVDFKGGATFAGLADLPHVSALVTNLGDDLGLVDRMADTLTGELVRRQEALHAAGCASLEEHRSARRRGADLEPMPSLFVCIDEFSELLSSRPDFIDVFVAIGRVGRSLGIHLLLASQRLEEGRLRGLETHLSYRIGLRTFSAAESRAAIGTPDAHALPALPGAGYLATGAGDPVRFTAAYVSGPLPRRAAPALLHRRPLPWTLRPVPDPPSLRDHHRRAAAVERERETTLEVVVRRTHGVARTHTVWLPPLEAPVTLGALLGNISHTPDLGVHAPRWRQPGRRRVPVAVVDRPREQRRDVWHLDLSGATGHCAVVGAPHSGKSTALRTLVTGLALTATPREIQFLLLDLAGGALAPLDRLPHVIGSAARGSDMVHRVVAEATDLVDRREAYFRAEGIDSFETYLRRRAVGSADDGLGEVFVVVDGWNVLRADDMETEVALLRMAERALTHGIHLVVATQRWGDLRPALRDLMGSRLELRLGDPMESTVDRRRAAGVPADPGHGLADGGHALLTAVPALPTPPGAPEPPDAFAHLLTVIDRGWSGARPRRLARLPDRVTLAELRATAGNTSDAALRDHLLLGWDGRAPVVVDPAAPSHLMVRGGPGSGRTNTLRVYLDELQRLHHPSRMQVVLVDPRGTLEGTVRSEHLLHHLVSRTRMRSGLTELASYLQERLPGAEVTAEQLRHRSWWSGAEVTVVVDDHDLATAGNAHDSGLHLLAPLVTQARDVGLHVVLAQRATSRPRSGDALVQALTDLEVTTVELTGSVHAGGRSSEVVGRATVTTRTGAPRTVQVAHAHHEACGTPL